MKCPHCQKTLDLADYVTINVDTYGKSAIARTGCCNALVRVEPIRTYRVSEYTGIQETDDWGR